MNEPDFQRHAQDEFRFLVEQWGFTQTSSETNRISYTSRDVMVEVNYSGRGEVDLVLDENPPSNRFQLRLFLKAYHPAVERTLGYGIANSGEEVGRELNRLANALRQYGRPLLEHERDVFEKMKTFKWWEKPS